MERNVPVAFGLPCKIKASDSVQSILRRDATEGFLAFRLRNLQANMQVQLTCHIKNQIMQPVAPSAFCALYNYGNKRKTGDQMTTKARGVLGCGGFAGGGVAGEVAGTIRPVIDYNF